jgi:hypothetical protein
MGCDPVDLGEGVSAIVCTRGRSGKKPCSSCGRPAGRLCDYPVTRGLHKATCDRPICTRCTTSISGDRDLCRPHAALWKGDGEQAGQGGAL